MAFTRFHDDHCRISKQLDEIHNIEQYHLNVPGNGLKPLFMSDPYIRLEKWGGNLTKNVLEIQDNLMGLNRKLNRDCLNENNYKKNDPKFENVQYENYGMFTEQPRSSNPAWMLRDLEGYRFNILFKNPQNQIEIPFEHNIYSKRLLKKKIMKKIIIKLSLNNKYI